MQRTVMQPANPNTTSMVGEHDEILVRAGAVWILSSGKRLEWVADWPRSTFICAHMFEVDGAHLEPNTQIPPDMAAALDYVLKGQGEPIEVLSHGGDLD